MNQRRSPAPPNNLAAVLQGSAEAVAAAGAAAAGGVAGGTPRLSAGPRGSGMESPASGTPRGSAAAAAAAVGGGGGGRGAEGAEHEAGEERSEAGGALLSIVVDQRERFRKQAGRLEEENSRLRAELGETTETCSGILHVCTTCSFWLRDLIYSAKEVIRLFL